MKPAAGPWETPGDQKKKGGGMFMNLCRQSLWADFSEVWDSR